MKDPDWIAALRRELLLTPMKSNFTLTRDELVELLGGYPAVLAAACRHSRVRWAVDDGTCLDCGRTFNC